VKFSGKLRSDLFEWMADMEQIIDLCLCLGTSLSGMNADRVAWKPAERFFNDSEGNGTIMINLQKTKIDSLTTIRVWAKLDDAFKILVDKLELDMEKLRGVPKLEKDDIFYLPYDENGKYLGKNPKKLMKLDFRKGAKIKIINPHSSVYKNTGEISKKDDDHYSVLMPDSKDSQKSRLYALGFWMIDAAKRGALDIFSFANIEPIFVENKKDEEKKEKKR